MATATVEHKERTTSADVVDLVWLGGFLDARGSLITRGIPRLIIRHEDEDVARRVARLTGGSLKGPKQDRFPDRSKEGQPYWLVTLYNYYTLKDLYERLKPYISEARYEQVMDALESYEPPNARRMTFAQENCGYYDHVQPNASGYVRHRRRKEEACRMCTECERAYYREKQRQIRSRR